MYVHNFRDPSKEGKCQWLKYRQLKCWKEDKRMEISNGGFRGCKLELDNLVVSKKIVLSKTYKKFFF